MSQENMPYEQEVQTLNKTKSYLPSHENGYQKPKFEVYVIKIR